MNDYTAPLVPTKAAKVKAAKDPSSPKNKGGRPRAKVDVNAPEFQAAVNAAVEAATNKFAEKLANARAAAGSQATSITGDDRKFARELALAMAEISDQGTNRKRIAPEILAKRADARDRMVDLLAKAAAQKLKPRYQLSAKVYLEERFIEPYRVNPTTKQAEPTQIIWGGPPSEAMVPVNEIATDIFNAFMESIGGMTVVDKTSDGRAFIAKGGPVGVTPGGLVIIGDSNPRRHVGGLADSGGDPVPGRNLEIEGDPNDPRTAEVRVLGTVMPPARRNQAIGAARQT